MALQSDSLSEVELLLDESESLGAVHLHARLAETLLSGAPQVISLPLKWKCISAMGAALVGAV